MPNPVTVSCPENQWTLAASNVTSGSIKKLSNKPNKYLETYRLTGQAAPTDQTEGAEVFTIVNPGSISSSVAIDVYIMAVGAAGKVRRDVS